MELNYLNYHTNSNKIQKLQNKKNQGHNFNLDSYVITNIYTMIYTII